VQVAQEFDYIISIVGDLQTTRERLFYIRYSLEMLVLLTPYSTELQYSNLLTTIQHARLASVSLIRGLLRRNERM